MAVKAPATTPSLHNQRSGPRIDEVAAALPRLSPFDEFCSPDGVAAVPEKFHPFFGNEMRYAPDRNDGVRVNIEPLQRAGLLAADVLPKKDVEVAIADRTAWRADERRWSRQHKVPRPGFWPPPRQEC